jgi:hypothetical protein
MRNRAGLLQIKPRCLVEEESADEVIDKSTDFRCWQILLKKSFWGDERKFLEPLMRLTRGDVRDHIALAKIDHGPS